MMKSRSKRSLLVTAALTANRLILAAQDVLKVLYDGIVPPLLGYARLQELNDRLYDYSGSMYLTDSHSKSGLYSWEREALDGHLVAGKHFAVLAAGGGREVLDLTRHGIVIDAWECNDTLREFGNRLLETESQSVRIQPMVPSQFPSVPDEACYDFCIVGWSAYSHMLRREDRVDFLKDMRKVLTGPVLLSFPGRNRGGRVKTFLRRVASLVPGATKGIPDDLTAIPGGCIGVGFDEQLLADEAALAGLEVKAYKNHSPEYPYVLLVPKQASLQPG